jgi:ribonuclease HI
VGKVGCSKRIWGLGFLNSFDFSKALAAHSLWRVITSGGIWHRIIKDKYLIHLTVTQWLRSPTFYQKAISKIWRGLIASMHLILHWLCWEPSSGQLISIGIDRILGLENLSFLSQPLVSMLNQNHYHTLAQVRKQSNNLLLSDYWLTSYDLKLMGNLAVEWDHFRKALIDLGIILQDKEDNLIWSGGDKSGIPSVKNIYRGIVTTKCLKKIDRWQLSIWQWHIQLKVKLFVWLVVEGRILTWESLQVRGWAGPSRCALCKLDIETIPHLFITCPFTIAVWDRVKLLVNNKSTWVGNTVAECFKSCFEDKISSIPLVAHLCWFIWIKQNKALFENHKPSIQAIFSKSIALQNFSSGPVKDKPPKSVLILYQLGDAFAWFDGASQVNGALGGAGGIIKAQDSTIIRWMYNCGSGSNSRAELIVAWATLVIVDLVSYHNLRVMGDSRVIIDWLSSKGRLQVSALEGWKNIIQVLIKSFQNISFHHVYRHFNAEADTLSKQALGEPEGHISFVPWYRGVEGPKEIYNIH